MTINFHDSGNDNGLFDVQGKAFLALATLQTAHATTIPNAVDDVFEIFNNLAVTGDLETAIDTLPGAIESFKRSAGSSLSVSLQQVVQNMLIEIVKADNPQPNSRLETALLELIKQMQDNSESVDASAVSVAVSANASNYGDGVIVSSTKRGNGLVQENMLAETIESESIQDGLTATVTFQGEESVPLLDATWPQGSGVTGNVGATGAASSLTLNGDMEDEDDVANAPDDWIFPTGTIGTTVKMTDVEVQTVVISGSPSAGHYLLIFTDKDGVSQTTGPIAYNATASAVQTALRRLTGLSSATVSASGTTPNFTHTVTFVGVPGNVPQLRSVNNTTGGTLAHATTTQGSSVTEVQTIAITGSPTGGSYTLTFTNPAGASQTTGSLTYTTDQAAVQAALRALTGLEEITVSSAGVSPNYTHTVTFTGIGGNLSQLTSANSLTGGSSPTITHATTTQGMHKTFAGGKALELDSDGSELTVLQQAIVNLSAETAYAVSLWAIADVVPAAGVITVDLVDGTGGSVIQDAQGAANSITFNAADLTKAWQHLSDLVSGEVFFRTPTAVPTVVYLRVRISTAVSTGTSIFLDNSALAQATELYPGGPMIAIFSGSKPFRKQDKWTITVTNNRGGRIQEWYNRAFNMQSLGLLLPSNSSGSETIPDSLAS